MSKLETQRASSTSAGEEPAANISAMVLRSILLRRFLAERHADTELSPPFSSVHDSSVQVVDDEGKVELVVSDSFLITNASDESEVARVEIVHSAIFGEIEGLSPGSAAEQEVVLEARLITYPAMRERLMSAVVAMGMPALVLPIVTRAELLSKLSLDATEEGSV